MEVRITGWDTPFKFNSLPDTGSTRSIVAHDLAQTYGMSIDSDSRVPLYAAGRKALRCEGSTQLQMEYMGHKTDVNALISSSLKDEILLSWHDLLQLGVIPQE